MDLSFTKNQTLILSVFFNNPERSFYLRELARIVGKKPGVFQRDINNLVTEDILKSHFQGNQRFFELNKKYPLYKEMKSIFFKTTGIEGALRKELKKIKGIQKAFIYGSFARSEEKKLSDVDLFVIGSINEDELIDLASDLEKKIDREVNYTLMTEREFAEKKKAGNSFLKNIFSKKQIKLI